MAGRRIITNRAKESIRNLYQRSTRKSIQRKQETRSLVDAMVELVDTTPLSPSNESRGILGVWKRKGYTIYETTNRIEGFWGQVKKMLLATYHFVSKGHLQIYIDESVFRYNTRKPSESDVFTTLYSKGTESN